MEGEAVLVIQRTDRQVHERLRFLTWGLVGDVRDDADDLDRRRGTALQRPADRILIGPVSSAPSFR